MEGMKFDYGKLRMDLLFSGCPKAVDAAAHVLTFGAAKYADNNWKVVPNGEQRYLAALLRHLHQIQMGEEYDSESGIHHMAHALTNMIFMCELALKDKPLEKPNDADVG